MIGRCHIDVALKLDHIPRILTCSSPEEAEGGGLDKLNSIPPQLLLCMCMKQAFACHEYYIQRALD